MLLRKLTTVAGVLLIAGLTLGSAGVLYRGAAPAPAAAADRPSEAAGLGRSAADVFAAADRPTPPADAGLSAFPAAESPRPADAPLGAPPRALAPPAAEGARPPQTRIGLINMTRVLKGSKKVQARQADLRELTKQAQEKLDVFKKEIQRYQAEHDAPATAADRREEYARRIKQLQREMEDESERAKARITKTHGDTVAVVYREVEDAANRVAKVKGLELVLFYTDAVTEDDFYNTNNLQRKLSQPGALMPMMVAPGMDITDVVIEALKKAHAPAAAGGQ
jgi:Skp family chaperone for outer membrane proteins